MVVEGCIRCHSNNTPRRRTRQTGHAVICQNAKACRARQQRRFRDARRTYAISTSR